MRESRFLSFLCVPFPKSGRPEWLVRSKREGTALGRIVWFAKWRRFVFEPAPGCVFDRECLRDLACWCDEQTRLTKAVPA